MNDQKNKSHQLQSEGVQDLRTRSPGRYDSLTTAHKEALTSSTNSPGGLTATSVPGDVKPLALAQNDETDNQKNLEGSAQVPVVWGNLPRTPEVVGQDAPQLSTGALPHVPQLQRRSKKREGMKDRDLNVRMTSEMREKLDAKAAALESYPSAHVLDLIASDLRLPVDRHRLARNNHLKRAFADLRIAFDDCGVNLNQMSRATNAGKPCPLTRQEIDEALKGFKRGCLTLETLRPS